MLEPRDALTMCAPMRAAYAYARATGDAKMRWAEEQSVTCGWCRALQGSGTNSGSDVTGVLLLRTESMMLRTIPLCKAGIQHKFPSDAFSERVRCLAQAVTSSSLSLHVRSSQRILLAIAIHKS